MVCITTSSPIATHLFIFLALFVQLTSTFHIGHRLCTKVSFSLGDRGTVLRGGLPIAMMEVNSPQNASRADYNQSQLLLKSNMVYSSISVKLPPGTDLRLSPKEEKILEKKEAAAKGNESMTDLDFFKEEMRRMIDKMGA